MPERREAWIVYYTDQQGGRHIQTFARKHDADAYAATVKPKRVNPFESGMPGPVRTCWLIFLMAVPIALGLHNQRVGGDFATAFFIGLIPAALVWALGEVAAFTVREWCGWRRKH